jgi:hypothetical protein
MEEYNMKEFVLERHGCDKLDECSPSDLWQDLTQYIMARDYNFSPDDAECFAEIVNHTVDFLDDLFDAFDGESVERDVMHTFGPLFHFAQFPFNGSEIYEKCRHIALKLVNGLADPSKNRSDIEKLLPLTADKVIAEDETKPVRGVF